jgi:hypothetical protein
LKTGSFKRGDFGNSGKFGVSDISRNFKDGTRSTSNLKWWDNTTVDESRKQRLIKFEDDAPVANCFESVLKVYRIL